MNFIQRLIHRFKIAPSIKDKINTLRGGYCRWFHRPVFYDNPPAAGRYIIQDLSCIKCGFFWKEYESHEFRKIQRDKEIKEQEQQQQAILDSDAFFCYTCSALEEWDCVCEDDLGFDESEIYHDYGT